MNDATQSFADAVRAATPEAPLQLRGGGSKDFYGHIAAGLSQLDTRAHTGIVAYVPSELVITARCGTPLADIESALAERGQFLAFEPPHFGAATLGGAIAAGLSGPRRAAAGAARDFVLGVRLMDGEARVLSFGGQVMKNVAGYDVSRLMVGSLGTLGLLLEISLKVLPLPVAEASLRFDLPASRALEALNAWAGQPLPISASCWHDDVLTVRLSGAAAAVAAAQSQLGGEPVPPDEARRFWLSLREQSHDFFAGDEALWRISLPSVTPPLAVSGTTLVEWGGAQRWLRSGMAAESLRSMVMAQGGHAVRFRGGDASIPAFHALSQPMLSLHRRLKRAFDPRGIFNPGRMSPDF